MRAWHRGRNLNQLLLQVVHPVQQNNLKKILKGRRRKLKKRKWKKKEWIDWRKREMKEKKR